MDGVSERVRLRGKEICFHMPTCGHYLGKMTT